MQKMYKKHKATISENIEWVVDNIYIIVKLSVMEGKIHDLTRLLRTFFLI